MHEFLKIKDKEATKMKLMISVGQILVREGFRKLGINHIARTAMVDKKLIYRYFGGFDGLIKSYLHEKDYWINLYSANQDENQHDGKYLIKENIEKILLNLIDCLKHNEPVKMIMVWELTDSKKMFKDLNQERELIFQDLLKGTDFLFEDSKVDIRACLSVIIAGLYYLSLREHTTGGAFFEVDINKDDGFNRLKKAVKGLVDLLFEAGVINTKKS